MLHPDNFIESLNEMLKLFNNNNNSNNKNSDNKDNNNNENNENLTSVNNNNKNNLLTFPQSDSFKNGNDYYSFQLEARLDLIKDLCNN